MRPSARGYLATLLVMFILSACKAAQTPAPIGTLTQTATQTSTPSATVTTTANAQPTSTPTATLTPMPTLTWTPAPTPTWTPSPTTVLTPAPDVLAGAVLTANDLPKGFVALPVSDRARLHLTDQDIARAFGGTIIDAKPHNVASFIHAAQPNFQVVAAYLWYPLSSLDQSSLDTLLSDPGSVVNAVTGTAAPSTGVVVSAKLLPGLNKLGDKSLGVSILFSQDGADALRADFVLVRRGNVAEAYYSFYLDQTRPLIAIADVVKILDARVARPPLHGGAPSPTPAVAALFQDNFLNPTSGWFTGASKTSSTAYAQGQLVIKIHPKAWLAWTNPGLADLANIHLEVTVGNSGPAADATFGLLCDYQDARNFYSLGIGRDGFYAIVRTVDGQDTVLTDPGNNWVLSGAIRKNAAAYRLGANCGNGRLTLYVDGQQINSVADCTFTAGDVGLFGLTFTQAEAEIHFANFVVAALSHGGTDLTGMRPPRAQW